MPEQFFNFFAPPRNDGSAKGVRHRLEEDIKFIAKSVRPHHPRPDIH